MYVRQLILALLVLACAASVAAGAAAEQGPNAGPAPPATTAPVTTTDPAPAPVVEMDAVSEHLYIVRIQHFRHLTWHWQRVMGVALTQPKVTNLRGKEKDVLRAVALKWKRLAYVASRRAHRVPHESAWLCIHRYEGAWTDGGGPYYGGLQMDWGFMARYGGGLLRTKGPANNWTPLEQMWVAEHAYESGRGFYPWPNTARACGLI